MHPASHYGMTRSKIKELGLSNSTVLKTCSTLSPHDHSGNNAKENVLFYSNLTDILSFCRCVRFNKSDVANRLTIQWCGKSIRSLSIHALLLSFIFLEICNAWGFRFVTVREML